MTQEELDKSRDESLQVTKDFIDKHLLDSHSVAYKMDFKKEIARMCGLYFDHGFNMCISEVEKVNLRSLEEASKVKADGD